METSEIYIPEPGSLVRVKKAIATDKASTANLHLPRYLRTKVWQHIPKNSFVVFVGVERIQDKNRSDLYWCQYSFIHDGIVCRTQPINLKPHVFFPEYIAKT